jgi:hypothetical protein
MSCLFAPSPTQTRSLSEGCSVWALGFGQLGATTTRTCLELFNKLLLVPGFFVCPSIHFEAAALQPRHTGARAPPRARCHPLPAEIPGHPQCLAGQIPNVYDRKIVPCQPRDHELLGPVPLPCLIADLSVPPSLYCRDEGDLTYVP